MKQPIIRRVWDMPNAETMSVPSIHSFAMQYLVKSKCSVDPFARNCRLAKYTNDLNPETAAEHHLDALEFLAMLACDGVVPDCVIFDPPYSARQVAECYEAVGRTTTMQDTQGKSWADWRDAVANLCPDGAVVLSFGWQSCGMGKTRGFIIEEILLCSHGGVHNDTICMAERKLPADAVLFGDAE